MHHQDFAAGESAGTTGGRKMSSHSSGFHHRRGSGSGSGSGSGGASAPSSAAAVAAVGGNANAMTGDEAGGGPQAAGGGGGGGSSSPGLHHHHHQQQQQQQLQSQAAAAGAQQQQQQQQQMMKKKSGFQITSVTSAQVSVSANNSLADDTESYDDMDESHTEDLSSSEMLDVSVSRATDSVGGGGGGGAPERSSSDETLNSLHGVDTPGLASPNEPPGGGGGGGGGGAAAAQQQASMVNGAVYPAHAQHPPPPGHFPPPHHGHHQSSDLPEGGTTPSSGAAAASPAVVPNSGPGNPNRVAGLSAVAGTTSALLPPLPPAAAALAGVESRTQTQTTVNAGPVGAPAAQGPTGYDSGAGGTLPAAAAVVAPTAAAAANNGQSQAPPAPTGSRFRVVKLDTNSEPFRKGRWTCTEYYEKEVPHAAAPAPAAAAETTPRPGEVAPAADADAGNQAVAAAGQGPAGPQQPPQTLQPHAPPGVQDFTSPGATQSPPQLMPLLQDPGAGQGPPNQGLPPHQAAAAPPPPSQVGYGAGRQPDFIQPTAPFQTQVPPPPSGVAMAMGGGAQAQQQQQPPPQTPQGLAFAQPQPQHRPYPLPAHGAPSYVPLAAALQADLQPLLAHGAAFPPGAAAAGGRTAGLHLEDAQRLFLQHRLEQQAVGTTLAHMGMAVEAGALMVAAAAAGLRGQPAEGDDDSSSGASVVAIDNKIEQAMDLVKSHLMYAVREEVEVLKEQIKELLEKNSQLETENTLLKTLASPEQMAQFHAQVQSDGSPTGVTGAGGGGGAAPGGGGGGGGVAAAVAAAAGNSPPVQQQQQQQQPPPTTLTPAMQNSGPSA